MSSRFSLEDLVWNEGAPSYRALSDRGLRPLQGGGLALEKGSLELLAREAFGDINFFMSRAHNEALASVLSSSDSSPNDLYVAEALLRNATIAAEGRLPLCQDTGTATVMAWRGGRILCDIDEASELETGIEKAYKERFLRFSQVAPQGIFEERNTGNNLPSQIDIHAGKGSGPGAEEYRFIFLAKGGGSANKTGLYQETKALLNPEAFSTFLEAKIRALGVAACPPYHIAVVIGGTSPEYNLKMLKLASMGLLDGLPAQAKSDGDPIRSREWEAKAIEIARHTGLGAQFGGSALALDARVIRLSRHAGSCPVSVGVSCSAHRQARGKITAGGIFLEELDRNPSRLLPTAMESASCPPRIDLDGGMASILRQLSARRLGDLVLLNGSLIVARDAAHARLHAMLKSGKALPSWFKDHPVYYAGPSETPPGLVIGSFGPTTAQRMDLYVADFMAAGASLVMLAKGNRAESVTEACVKFGGFYLGTIGGAAASIAHDTIVACEIVDYADLGMEAVRLIRVKDMPAFILVDDKGGDFYAGL